MKKLFSIGVLAALGGCTESMKTAEGCPIYMTEIMQAYTEGCQKAYYDEKARASGGTITRCFGGTGDMTCVSE